MRTSRGSKQAGPRDAAAVSPGRLALPPVQAKERHTQTRARTGFNLTRVDGRWIVTELVAGGPAEAAGVKAIFGPGTQIPKAARRVLGLIAG